MTVQSFFTYNGVLHTQQEFAGIGPVLDQRAVTRVYLAADVEEERYAMIAEFREALRQSGSVNAGLIESNKALVAERVFLVTCSTNQANTITSNNQRLVELAEQIRVSTKTIQEQARQISDLRAGTAARWHIKSANCCDYNMREPGDLAQQHVVTRRLRRAIEDALNILKDA